MKNNVTKYIALILVTVVMGGGILLLAEYIKINSNEDKIEVAEIPLKIEELPVEVNVSENGGNFILQVQYKNNSKYDVSRLVLEVKLKDLNEIITLPIGEVVKSGKVSGKYDGKAPNSGKAEDIEILKYKISLSKGIYMEYDTELKQYNWS